MQWFYNVKLTRKLMLSFILICSLTVVLGIFSISRLNQVSQASTDIANSWLPGIKSLMQMQTSLARFRISELQHILSTEEQDYKATEKAFDSRLKILQTQQEHYEKLIKHQNERDSFAQYRQLLASYFDKHQKLVALSRNNQKEEARALFRGESNKQFRELTEQVDHMVKLNEDGSTASNNTAEVTYNISRKWIIVLLIGCVVVGLLLTFWISRMISRPLKEAVRVSKRIAQGDLTVDIEARSTDETGQMMTALKSMNDSLQMIVGNVRTSTEAITTAADEIAVGNLSLSNRTESQASSLEETASAIEELTMTVKQNANNANQANRLAASASDVAQQGGKVVGQVVQTMAAINESFRKIVDIIGVIDGIAFQTNILALNAAVEAARASEQGRGFAVVAAEVRTLAQRSATAAKEIKGLIGDAVGNVDAGIELVDLAGVTMQQVVDSVRHVTDVVSEISTASSEQSNGIEEINQAVAKMDEVTQQNAALVEQAAASAESLQDLATTLTQMVSVFKINQAHPMQVLQMQSRLSLKPQV
jgi:methyl-accepting chemotaxis protein